jgi:hypothetical protein
VARPKDVVNINPPSIPEDRSAGYSEPLSVGPICIEYQLIRNLPGNNHLKLRQIEFEIEQKNLFIYLAGQGFIGLTILYCIEKF